MPIIKATRREFVAALDQFVLCDLCASDESAFTSMYYIPDIDQIYCADCFDIWAQTAIYYKVDRKTIEKNFNAMREKMVAMGVWE